MSHQQSQEAQRPIRRYEQLQFSEILTDLYQRAYNGGGFHGFMHWATRTGLSIRQAEMHLYSSTHKALSDFAQYLRDHTGEPVVAIEDDIKQVCHQALLANIPYINEEAAKQTVATVLSELKEQLRPAALELGDVYYFTYNDVLYCQVRR